MRKAMSIMLVAATFAFSIAVSGCNEKESGKFDLHDVAIEKVQVGDIEVAYRSFGEGDPLIMVMGFSGTMDMWDPTLVEALSREYLVYTFDNRGMGETNAGTREFTMGQFAADTAGFIDAVGAERPHVLGWSMGTNIALELALEYPEKIDKLILYAADCGGTRAIQPQPEVMQELTDTSGTAKQRGKRLLGLLFPSEWIEQPQNSRYVNEVFGRASDAVTPQNVDKQAQAMATWEGCCDSLASIDNDTMLVTGTEDILTPPQNSVMIAEKIPGAWLVQLKGGGHGVMFQEPQRLACIVLTFLD